MKAKNAIKENDIKKKRISREEFAEELNPLSMMAQGLYVVENEEKEKLNLQKKNISSKKRKRDI